MSEQDTDVVDVVRELLACALGWDPEARLLGAERAADVVRVCEAIAVAEVRARRAERAVAAIRLAADVPSDVVDAIALAAAVATHIVTEEERASRAQSEVAYLMGEVTKLTDLVEAAGQLGAARAAISPELRTWCSQRLEELECPHDFDPQVVRALNESTLRVAHLCDALHALKLEAAGADERGEDREAIEAWRERAAKP